MPDIRFDQLAISYNGGKDCLVMLIIFLAEIHKNLERDPDFLRGIEKIPAVWVHPEDPFKEIDDFVVESSGTYSLDLSKRPYPLKSAFESYLHDKPDTKAVLVGIRRADPYGDTLSYIQRTDHGWPDFVRVHPVLEWHYVNIWDVSSLCPELTSRMESNHSF
jgi:3'-phosphoadenosine 5'-phosphosulfate sulfotransferase (PAPS reductase)/FAD synthetase